MGGYSHIKFRRDRFLPDDGTQTVQRAERLLLNATLNQPDDHDAATPANSAFPWRSLFSDQPAPKLSRQSSLLAVCLNGNDDRVIYHSTSTNLPNLMYHFSAAQRPVFKLTH